MELWLIDFGATSHMTYSKELLRNYRMFDVPQPVNLGDGRTVEAHGEGNIDVDMIFKVSNKKRCVMKNVLYVPKLTSNLFSVRAAVSKNNTIRFGISKCWIKDKEGKLIGMGTLKDRLYTYSNVNPLNLNKPL